MFEVLGVPMIDWVLSACEESGISDICVVTGYNHEVIERHLDGKYATVLQTERKGTGHAVMMAKEWLEERRGKNVLSSTAMLPSSTARPYLQPSGSMSIGTMTSP